MELKRNGCSRMEEQEEGEYSKEREKKGAGYMYVCMYVRHLDQSRALYIEILSWLYRAVRGRIGEAPRIQSLSLQFYQFQEPNKRPSINFLNMWSFQEGRIRQTDIGLVCAFKGSLRGLWHRKCWNLRSGKRCILCCYPLAALAASLHQGTMIINIRPDSRLTTRMS